MSRIIVVKLGSSSVTRSTGPDPLLLTSALDGAIQAGRRGWKVALVSSGSVSTGLAYLKRTSGRDVDRRVAAAVGQPFLMDIYRSVAEVSGATVCQILISEPDLHSAAQMSTISSILANCFDAGIIPVINGNDALDPTGSDNDLISAGVAVTSAADKLLMLTDVDGVYVGAPGASEAYAEMAVADIPHVAIGGGGTGPGRGGMRSKLRAGELAALNGIEAIIASAHTPHVILRAIAGEALGTRIKPQGSPQPPDRRWIAGFARSAGRLTINKQAEDSIREGSSLFASGIKKVSGRFARTDVVDIAAPSGALVARGRVKASSELLRLLRSLRGTEVASVLAAVVRRYAAASEGKVTGVTPPVETPPPVGYPPSVAYERALASIGRCGFETKRHLALEVMTLFPSVSAAYAVVGRAADERPPVEALYEQLSNRLSFVEREQLVVFSTAG